jgi:hypothetical protein
VGELRLRVRGRPGSQDWTTGGAGLRHSGRRGLPR